jgi:hypothetical protein
MALEAGADIVIMVHPDYQYTPKLIPVMAAMIGNDLYPFVLGLRILGGYALKGGMPLWKYIANRFLTLAENILLAAKLSEYHTVYRAFSRELLESLALDGNSNDYLFNNQMLAQIICAGLHDRRGELPNEILYRGVVHQPETEYYLWDRLPDDGPDFSAVTDESHLL